MTVVLEHTGFPPLTEAEVRAAYDAVMATSVGEIDPEYIDDAIKLGYLLAARKVTGASL